MTQPMNNYQKPTGATDGPSQPAKKERPKIQPIVQGRVSDKRPIGHTFRKIFFGGTAQDLVQGVINDILIPAAKDMVTEAVTQSIHRAIYGENAPQSTRRYGSPVHRASGYQQTNYAQRYAQNSTARQPEERLRQRTREEQDPSRVTIPTRMQAMEVRGSLLHMIEEYGSVSIQEFYEYVGLDLQVTDGDWGWKAGMLDHLQIMPYNGEFILNFPPMVHLD